MDGQSLLRKFNSTSLPVDQRPKGLSSVPDFLFHPLFLGVEEKGSEKVGIKVIQHGDEEVFVELQRMGKLVANLSTARYMIYIGQRNDTDILITNICFIRTIPNCYNWEYSKTTVIYLQQLGIFHNQEYIYEYIRTYIALSETFLTRFVVTSVRPSILPRFRVFASSLFYHCPYPMTKRASVSMLLPTYYILYGL